jgi:hypothetical protein
MHNDDINTPDEPDRWKRAEATPYMLHGVRSQDTPASQCVAELIDNSEGCARGAATEIVIRYDGVARVLQVLDNGVGMDNILPLFTFGDGVRYHAGDKGQYGMGGTTAIATLSSTAKVQTLTADGLTSFDTVDWDKCIKVGEWPLVDTYWCVADNSNTPADLLAYGHGTCITMHVPRNIRFKADAVERALASMYASAARAGVRIYWDAVNGNGRRLLEDPNPVVFNGAPMEVSSSVMYHGKVLSYAATIGIAQDGAGTRTGVRMACGIRNIRNNVRECFAHKDVSYAAPAVVGNIDLGADWAVYLTTLKNDIKDESLRVLLMADLFKHIEPVLQRAASATQNMRFDKLTLSLNKMFSGSASQRTGGSKVTPGGPPVPSPDPEPSPPHKKHKKGDPDTEGKRKLQAICDLDIERATDFALSGALADVALQGDRMFIQINAEHPAVLAALDAMPHANALAYQLLIISAIGAFAAQEDAHWRRILANNRMALAAIEDRREAPEFTKWLPSYITRVLMELVQD